MNICPARSNILARDTATIDLLLKSFLKAFNVAPFSGVTGVAFTLSLFPKNASNSIAKDAAAITPTPIIVIV